MPLPFLGSGFVLTDSMLPTTAGPLADLPQGSTACREWLRRPDRWKP
jgi:hypothetical protein